MLKGKKTLLLNVNMLPIAVISARRAIVLSFINFTNRNKGLEIVDYYNEFVLTSGGHKFPIPSVVKSPVYIKDNKRKVAFSRKNVFLRDGFCCCYCGKQDLSAQTLTYDHVVSRAEWNKLKYNGSPTSWNNIVTSCVRCNRRKGQKSLKDSGMNLLKYPSQPKPYDFILGLNPWGKVEESWEPYITPLYKHLLHRTDNEQQLR